MALNDDQAQADGNPADDTETAVDQVTDATEASQQGTNPLAAYEAELAKAMAPADDTEEQEQSVPDEVVEGDGQEQESDAGDGADEGAPGNSSEEEGEEEVKASKRVRLRDPDEIAIHAIKNAKGISLAEAADVFRGLTPTKRAADLQESIQEESIETVASITDEIDRLIEDQAEKAANLEFESAAAVGKQIEKLRNKREDVRFVEAQEKSRAEAQAEQAFHAKFAENEATTVKFYPDAAVHDSPLAKRMKELDDQAKELDDPIYYSPEKPFLLAKAAARELGILMTKPGATPPAKKASANRPIQPAGGNARTTAPATEVSRLDQAIANAKDEASYEKLLAEIGV